MTTAFHWGPDPGHGGLTKHKGLREDCPGPDCGDMIVEAGDSLARSLAWLGTEDCSCPHHWGSLGRLYNISMGQGWIRTDTDPACRHHGSRADG